VNYRLLRDSEVFAFLQQLKRAEREALWKRLEQIRDSPVRFSDYAESDARGRHIDASICGRFAIHYWDDFADRHVKVLEITNADDFAP
jgi:hypothetical protein